MSQRQRKGSTMAELGPALFILFLLILFPLIDLLDLTLSYSLCWYMNFKISNQVARCKQVDGLRIAQAETNAVLGTSFANFLGLNAQSLPPPALVYDNSAIPPAVGVTTFLTVKPFVTVPFFMPVAGLNAPVTFTIASRLPREFTL